MTYEDIIGPIHPGFYTPISLGLQDRLREIEQERALDRVWVDLRTLQYKYSSQEISAILGLKPTDVTEEGGTIYKSEKHHIKATGTHWSLSSKKHVAGADFQKHLKWMLSQLDGKLPSIRLLQQDKCNLTITAHMHMASQVIAPRLDEEILGVLAQLRIPLEFIVKFDNCIHGGPQE